MNMTSHKGNHIYNLDQSIICFIYIYVIWFELIFTPKEIDGLGFVTLAVSVHAYQS